MNEPIAPSIPDFRLIRPVGSGGFGQVWLAANRTTGQLRAVKVIPLQQTGRADPAAREISSLTRLESNLRCRHPNLLQIHHVGKTADHLFYVMDLADDASGGAPSDHPGYVPATLQARLDGGPLASETCLDYARQLLAGLASLHAVGMVHRDVKPANCLFVDGRLKLADFGLLTEAHPLVSRVGTRKYMPPDGRMDMRADVYAAGLVIYEILSGLPVDEFPRLGRQTRQITGNPILAALLRVVLQACEREPEQRFADAQAMLAELEEPVKLPYRWPRRRTIATTCIAGVAAAAVGAWILASTHLDLGLLTIPSAIGRPEDKPQASGRVDVSFVTDPYEARIYLDDTLLVDSNDVAFTTPCTVDDLPARVCRVSFERDGLPRWDAGQYDFARTRQIFSRRR